MEKLSSIPSWVFTLIIVGVGAIGGYYGFKTHVEDIEREFRKEFSRVETRITDHDVRIRDIEVDNSRIRTTIEHIDKTVTIMNTKIDKLLERKK